MGTPTGLFVNTVRHTGRSSEHYGPCELCGGRASSIDVSTHQRIYRHADGFHYLSPASGGKYAHMACLIEQYGPQILASTLERRGGLLVIPESVVREKLMAESWKSKPQASGSLPS